MAKNNFTQDDKIGRVGERAMTKFIHEKMSTQSHAYIYQGRAEDFRIHPQEYDLRFGVYPIVNDKMLIFPSGHTTYEVKTDVYPINTGNMIIERSKGGHPKGLFVTKATYFIYFYMRHTSDNVWIIDTNDLKTIVKDYNHTLCYGGDDGTTFMYKIPKEDLRKYFQVYSYSHFEPYQDSVEWTEKTQKVTYFSDKIKYYPDPFENF